MNPRTDFYRRHRTVIPIILFNNKYHIPVAELAEVCEPQDNEDELLVFETGARYGPDGSHVPLPLKDWRVQPQLRVWFDIVLLRYRFAEFFRWTSPTPKEVGARLEQLQWRYGKEPMLPDLEDYLLGEMQTVLACEELEHRFKNIRRKLREYWERLHEDWRHAHATWPSHIALPVANFGGRLVKHHPMNGLL